MAQLSVVARSIHDVLQVALDSAMDEVGEPLPQSQAQRSTAHQHRPQQHGHLCTTNTAVFTSLTVKKAKIAAAMRQLHATAQGGGTRGRVPASS